MFLIYVTVPTASALWFDTINLLQFKITFEPVLKSLVLLAMSSQTATYDQMASPYVPLYFVQFGHLASICRTRVLHRRTVENILTGSSAAHKTITSVHIFIT
jgi:hypothetical protein